MTYLTEKQIEQITKVSAEVAVQEAKAFWEKQKAEDEKARKDYRLRNVKLLLKHYRKIAAASKDIKLEIDALNEKLELEYLNTDEFQIESIKRSKSRSIAMVKYVNHTLGLYKLFAEENGNSEEQRRYDTVYKMYIAEEKSTAEDISELHFITPRMVYNDVNKACETLAVLMFGVDGVKFLH